MPEPGAAAKQTTGLHDSQKEVSQMTLSDTTTAHPIVLSHTLDAATVTSTRWLIDELRKDGNPVDLVAEVAAEHLADTVAFHRPSVDADHDPTDAELEPLWNEPGWSERNERVMRLVRDIASGAA